MFYHVYCDNGIISQLGNSEGWLTDNAYLLSKVHILSSAQFASLATIFWSTCRAQYQHILGHKSGGGPDSNHWSVNKVQVSDNRKQVQGAVYNESDQEPTLFLARASLLFRSLFCLFDMCRTCNNVCYEVVQRFTT